MFFCIILFGTRKCVECNSRFDDNRKALEVNKGKNAVVIMKNCFGILCNSYLQNYDKCAAYCQCILQVQMSKTFKTGLIS